MKKTIVLVVGFLLSVTILTLFLTGTPPKPPLMLTFTSLLLLAFVIDQAAQSVKKDLDDKAKRRVHIFFWIVIFLLVMSIMQILIWKMTFEDDLDDLLEPGTEEHHSMTFYEKTDTISYHPPVKKDEPEYPFYKKDEVCELNLRELVNIIRNEWNHTAAGYRQSQSMLTIDHIGTRHFRFVANNAEHRYPKYMLPTDAIMTMALPTDHPVLTKPISVRLRLKDSRIVESLLPNKFYLIEGTLVIEKQDTDQPPYDEMSDEEKYAGIYIQVDSIEQVVAETAIINKAYRKPPWNPTEYKRIGE